MWLTNGGEIAAFFLARAISLTLYYLASSMFLSALLLQAYHVGGRGLMTIAGLAASLVGWLVTLLLLVLFRAGLGGVPPTVAAPENRSTVTTSGAEVGAFLLAFVATSLLVSAFNTMAFGSIYGWLRASGHAGFMPLVSLGVSAVSAAVFFLIFVALRGAMARPALAGDAAGSGPG
jgi:hypothetical protein